MRLVSRFITSDGCYYEGHNLPDDFKLGDYTDVIDILILFLLNINKHRYFFHDLLDFNSKKNCFKCGLIHGNDTESNELMWGNCEFSFKCPNWYCPKCIPPRTSMSDELICSDCK